MEIEELTRLQDSRRELERQIAVARAEIARHQLDKTRLEKQLTTLERDLQQFTSRWAEVEQHNSDLTHLNVASAALHGSLDRGAVLTAIQEIIINLLGSEELGVFEMSEDGASLKLVDSFGLEADRFRNIAVGAGAIGEVAANGEAMVDGKEGLTACVPLKVGDRTVGVIAVFKLLPQKGKLGQVDRELLELLRSQAGVALYCTRLLAEKQP